MSAQHPNQLELSIEELMCGICFNTVSEPKTTPCCRAMYCKGCVSDALKYSKRCPYCRAEINKKSLMSVPRIIDNLLDSIGNDVRPSSTSVRTPSTITNSTTSAGNALTPTTSAETRINYLEQMNSRLENEIYRLRRRLNDIQIPVVSSSTPHSSGANSSMRSVIDSAQTYICNYVIEERSALVTRKWVGICIGICQEAVLTQRSYLKISEMISEELNDRMGASRIWHSIVWQQNCGESLISIEESDRFLRVRFNELIIEIFAF